MTIETCYQKMGGDYNEVLGRLGSEALVRKFLLKFLEDQSYPLLERAMAGEDWAEAFRAAHMLKGVCQNLAFSRLAVSSSALTEALRGGYSSQAPALAEDTARDYAVTVEAIRAYQSEL